jgi:uncharacterized LabA/DUF88 family protein
MGIECFYKEPKVMHNKRGDLVHKADWDLGIALDVVDIIQGKGLDTVILCSADGDMAPLATWCRKRGAKVIIIACGISFELENTANTCIEIPRSLLMEDKK